MGGLTKHPEHPQPYIAIHMDKNSVPEASIKGSVNTPLTKSARVYTGTQTLPIIYMIIASKLVADCIVCADILPIQAMLLCSKHVTNC